MEGSDWVRTAAWGSARGRGFALLALSGLVLAGCGQDRQDADEPRRDFRATADAQLASSQRLAEPRDLVITVRNMDREAMPDVAVTLDGLYARLPQTASSQRIADPARPIWIVDEQPQGAPTGNRTTWAGGRLAPGGERTFRWRLSPVKAGRHRISYRVSAGLNGRALARADQGGGPLRGTLDVSISDSPGDARVDPDTGEPVQAG